MKPGEIIVEIQIPDLSADTRSGYLKLKERGAWDFTVVSVAAVVQKNGASFTSGAVALGGVAPIPWLEKEVSTQLTSFKINPENIEHLSKKALDRAEPLGENAYKVSLARNMIKKLLLKFS